MYDTIETDISYEYLAKLAEKAINIRWAVCGGWGVFFHVNEEYKRAFGKDYLSSRDIDVFIDSKEETYFLKIIEEMGFKESAYHFRYELIYDREEKKIISDEHSKKKHIFNLVYIFLDVFSNRKTKKLGSWVIPDLKEAKIEKINNYLVLDTNSLLALKINSLFGREKLDKELKDACDVYALLFYSGKRVRSNLLVKKAAEKIISRKDLQDYIAEQVLGDVFKASLVNRRMNEFLNV